MCIGPDLSVKKKKKKKKHTHAIQVPQCGLDRSHALKASTGTVVDLLFFPLLKVVTKCFSFIFSVFQKFFVKSILFFIMRNPGNPG